MHHYFYRSKKQIGSGNSHGTDRKCTYSSVSSYIGQSLTKIRLHLKIKLRRTEHDIEDIFGIFQSNL